MIEVGQTYLHPTYCPDDSCGLEPPSSFLVLLMDRYLLIYGLQWDLPTLAPS